VKLPNGDRAIVSLSRLTDYLLNSQHATGKHKARVFASALGPDSSGAEVFRQWLLSLAADGDAEAGLTDAYGQRFVISGKMLYKGQEALLRTAWIVRQGCADPEFLTALVE
jgi:hypothetical protein